MGAIRSVENKQKKTENEKIEFMENYILTTMYIYTYSFDTNYTSDKVSQ